MPGRYTIIPGIRILARGYVFTFRTRNVEHMIQTIVVYMVINCLPLYLLSLLHIMLMLFDSTDSLYSSFAPTYMLLKDTIASSIVDADKR